jgi:hypothetical protein
VAVGVGMTTTAAIPHRNYCLKAPELALKIAPPCRDQPHPARTVNRLGDLDLAVELEHVVDLDRQVHHPDLASDTATLERLLATQTLTLHHRGGGHHAGEVATLTTSDRGSVRSSREMVATVPTAGDYCRGPPGGRHRPRGGSELRSPWTLSSGAGLGVGGGGTGDPAYACCPIKSDNAAGDAR